MTYDAERLHRRIDDHANRIGAVENSLTEIQTDIKYITKAVSGMQNQLGWVVKSVLGSIVLAFMAYLIQGGFSA